MTIAQVRRLNAAAVVIAGDGYDEDYLADLEALLAALGGRRSPVVKCAGVPVHVPSPDAEREAGCSRPRRAPAFTPSERLTSPTPRTS